MNIRQATPADREILFEVWLSAVRATHAFVSEEDIESFMPLVRDYLASSETELWVLCTDAGTETIMGFMGLAGSEIESLFVAPEFHRQGGGRQLVKHAKELRSHLTVSVNEQNVGAVRFRSATDSTGRPYPLLHMRLPSV